MINFIILVVLKHYFLCLIYTALHSLTLAIELRGKLNDHLFQIKSIPLGLINYYVYNLVENKFNKKVYFFIKYLFKLYI